MLNRESKKRIGIKQGFTLIELMVAMGLFAVVLMIGIGAVLQILNINNKSQSMNVVLNNLNAGMEAMTIQLRYGEGYGCGASCDLGLGSESIQLMSHNGERVEYFLDNGQIMRSVDGIARGVSAPEVTIEHLRFYNSGTHAQPLIVMLQKGYIGEASRRSEFSLQTAVSQRLSNL